MLKCKSDVYCIDNLKYMATLPDKAFDLAICDPPYGINIKNNMGRRKGDKNSDYKKVVWDSSTPNDLYFNELFRISNKVIVWGGNYFSLPPTKSFLVWRKPQINEQMSFSMCEYAWTNFEGTSKEFTGMSNEKDRIHPTQKPVALYAWILKNYAHKGDKIFDPNMGSQSSRIACYEMGFDYVGCEIDKDYFDAGCKRFDERCLGEYNTLNGEKWIEQSLF